MTQQLDAINGAALTVADLARVRQAVADSAAPNTRRAYGGALGRFADWLAARGLDLGGQDAEQQDATVAAYLADRADQGAAPATVALDSAAIGAAARDSRARDPRGPITARTIKGLRRQAAQEAADGAPRGRGQVAGLRRESVEAAAVLAAADGSPAGLRDAAMLRLGSDGFLRVSELAAIQVADLELDQGDGSGRLRIRRSKTDQDGDGAVLYLGPPTVATVRAWLAASGIAEGPLFRRLSRAGALYRDGQALSARAVRDVLRQRGQAAGVGGRLSGHSLRVGSAQSLVAAGADLPALMQAGRWQDSATAAGYAAGELAGRGAVARFFYGVGK